MRGFCHADAVEDFRREETTGKSWKEEKTGVFTKRKSTRRS
jgi:hypothetical protein